MKRSIAFLLGLFPLMTLSWLSAAHCPHGKRNVCKIHKVHPVCPAHHKKSTSCCDKLRKTHCKVRKLCVSIPARGSIPAAEIFVKIQGESKGDRPTLVFIHGTAESSDSWACQQEELCTEFRTIAFDLRGAGRSSRPELITYTYQLFADDIHAVLRKLGVKKFVYVGHSIGANVGLVYATMFPEEVTKLVLIAGDPFLVVPDCAVAPDCSPETCSACWPFPLTTLSGAEAIEAQINEIGFDEFAVLVSKTLFFNENCQKKLVKAQALNVDQFIRTGEEGFLNMMFNTWTEDIRPLLPEITIPTLICVGSIDAVVPPGASFFMHDAIPSSILAEFAGMGHNLMVSDYKNFNKILTRFVDGCSFPDITKVLNPSCCVCPLARPVNFNKQACT